MQRLIPLSPLASLRGNPIQDKQAWNHVGEDAIQGITDGVGVMIDGEKHLDAKGRNEYNHRAYAVADLSVFLVYTFLLLWQESGGEPYTKKSYKRVVLSVFGSPSSSVQENVVD
jgi:hypothetical protein